MSWTDSAREVIAQVHASLPPDATYEQRKKALHDAYPFGPRQYFPYKCWCKAQRAYLAKYKPPKDSTPLESVIFAAGRADD